MAIGAEELAASTIVQTRSPLGIQVERLEGPVFLRRPCHGHSRPVADSVASLPLPGPLCIQAGRLQMLVLPRRFCHGRPEHIKRTCDGSIPSNARIRFMLGRRPWTAIQKREELSQDPTRCAKIRSALGNEHRENEPPTCEEDVPEQALDRQDGPVPPLRLHLGGTMPPLRKWVPRPPSRS